ncbi:AAA family ATPase [Hathewaya histolytica]|uniref:Uncharacterized AAA domain-containing protein ycf46 n=1 Tax=Hathewaya histolytica TaxID=1498 RepID=A0A4U9R8X3_HATHI|nr:AAA family ATPase [Hathewaya histolytica]VTQ86603.1 ATPase, AAA family [Hathewaya histolytica]
MSINTIEDKISLYVDAQYPIIHIDTYEESRAEKLIKNVCYNFNIYEWNRAKGLTNSEESKIIESQELEEAIDYFNSLDEEELDRKALIIKDVHYYIKNSEVLTKLKRLVLKSLSGVEFRIFFIGPLIEIPLEISEYVTVFELETLTKKDIENFIREFIRVYEVEVVEDEFIEYLSILLKGLTESEIENILSLSYATYGEISCRALNLILEEKAQVVRKSGVLTMVLNQTKFEEIGGLKNIKKWLSKKAFIFKEYERALSMGIEVPKGVCIVGMPGCGKSLTAKGAGDLFKVPTLRFDMGGIIGSHVGEAECNMKKAIKYAERFSPCILWIDEIEKAFSEMNSTVGGKQEALIITSYFLTWLQEKKTPVFVVATANSVKNIPSELLRKGRFDEVFFVDFPKEEERREILEVHLKKRKGSIEGIDIDYLSKATEGFTGVSIESIIKESMENAFIDGREEITNEDIISAIESNYDQREILKTEVKEKYNIFKEHNFKNASK